MGVTKTSPCDSRECRDRESLRRRNSVIRPIPVSTGLGTGLSAEHRSALGAGREHTQSTEKGSLAGAKWVRSHPPNSHSRISLAFSGAWKPRCDKRGWGDMVVLESQREQRMCLILLALVGKHNWRGQFGP